MATNFTETALDIFLSRIPQTNYTTATVAAAGPPKSFIAERVKQRAFPQITPVKRNNKDYTGGKGFATESWVESWTSSYAYALDLASQNIGRYLLAAFGSVTTTELTVGVYKHLFKPLDRRTTAVMPAYSIGVQNAVAAGGVNSLLPSMTCDKLQLASAGKARLDGNISFTGAGDEVAPSGVTPATHVQSQEGALNYFYHQQSNLNIADAPNAANAENLTTCHLLGWNFATDNSFAADDYGCPRFKTANNPESGVLRSHYLLIAQAFMLDYLLKMRTNDPAHTALVQQKPLEIEAKLTGGVISGAYNHQLAIKSYLAKYDTVDRGFTDGFATVQVKPDLLYSTTDDEIVTAELINDVPSYVA